ncbi:Peptidase S12 Pab87-related C-terminal [Penicillium chrysogenum]|uniref:Peptidase S12 Pab87-related C-terminal n=1 Tax=Penicillium chrysogenum TaxID=5076 RepID=A0ABQ8WPQ1_PENCH|nr:Peptidase S12 Pab87-related C-terminal [Penicillium chrysogenum]KAJ5252096.1 Peptidase S12 Pab87-related C-terminal [Penicillium chrysogenum]KAJ5271001.1 Peptidase S12 Pab87-related C-terminal [Penicillium chrysogenum]KAJ6146245.1 Peptidase S12 Pab87-related C-terminal [Penicillium chrysogenum]
MRYRIGRKGSNPGSIVRAMRYMPLATTPRTKYHYSNCMYIAVSHVLEQQIAACMARQTEIWESSLKNEDTEDSKRRLFPSLFDPPTPCALHTHTPQERLLPSTLQISNNGLIADLQDRAILCKLSLVHASGKFFVGSIRNAGFDLIPPFAVEFYINAAGVAKRIGLLLEPGLKGKMLWFDRCDT